MKIIFSIVILASCALAPFARAQKPDASRTAEQQAIREAIIQKIEQVKYQKVKTVLAMDDAAADRFFAIYKPAEHDVQALVKERNDVMKSLATATNSNTSDADVAAMAQKVRNLNEQISDREQKLDGDLKPILSPLQRAKLLVFEHEFNQRIREQVAAHKLQNQNLRYLRRQLREQRLKNRLLQKKAGTKATGGP
jgi:predicted lipoprotein